ncbi:hypothetical protein, partial [Enterococcus cecorum]|uniref:hypothetical protein n=1 Tax=Enterococcus cecorum TaxID=44008 RepID=UPI001FAB98B7
KNILGYTPKIYVFFFKLILTKRKMRNIPIATKLKLWNTTKSAVTSGENTPTAKTKPPEMLRLKTSSHTM